MLLLVKQASPDGLAATHHSVIKSCGNHCEIINFKLQITSRWRWGGPLIIIVWWGETKKKKTMPVTVEFAGNSPDPVAGHGGSPLTLCFGAAFRSCFLQHTLFNLPLELSWARAQEEYAPFCLHSFTPPCSHTTHHFIPGNKKTCCVIESGLIQPLTQTWLICIFYSNQCFLLLAAGSGLMDRKMSQVCVI